jgi:hypothetical protein
MRPAPPTPAGVHCSYKMIKDSKWSVGNETAMVGYACRCSGPRARGCHGRTAWKKLHMELVACAVLPSPVAIRWSRQASRSSIDLCLSRPRPPACHLRNEAAARSAKGLLLTLQHHVDNAACLHSKHNIRAGPSFSSFIPAAQITATSHMSKCQHPAPRQQRQPRNLFTQEWHFFARCRTGCSKSMKHTQQMTPDN